MKLIEIRQPNGQGLATLLTVEGKDGWYVEVYMHLLEQGGRKGPFATEGEADTEALHVARLSASKMGPFGGAVVHVCTSEEIEEAKRIAKGMNN